MEPWKRTYWTVWGANLVTAIGMQSFLPFFPSHLEELGLTDRASVATWSGLLYGAAPLSAAIMAPLWGALGDRYGRRLMVLRAMLAIAVFVGAMAFATTPEQVLVLRILQGVFSGFVAPSMTLVSISAPKERQGSVSGSLQTAMALGAVIGPVLGALIRSVWGIRPVYMVVAAAALASSAAVAFFTHEDPSKRRQPAESTSAIGILRGTAQDVRELWGNANLRSTVILLFWVQFGLGATNPVLELFVRELWSGRVELVPSLTGAAFSMMAAVNLVALPLWGRYSDRSGHARAMVRCAVWSAAALGLQGLAPTYVWLVLPRLVLGGSMAGAGPCAFGVAAAETSADRRGGAFGLVFSARAIALAISAMAGGALSAATGIRGLFLIGALLILASAWSLRRHSVPALKSPHAGS